MSLATDQQTVVLLPRSSSAAKTYQPIPVDHLEEEYRIRSADDGKLFREEYNVRSPWRRGFKLIAPTLLTRILKEMLLPDNPLVCSSELGKILRTCHIVHDTGVQEKYPPGYLSPNADLRCNKVGDSHMHVRF